MQLTGRPNSAASSFVVRYVKHFIVPEGNSTKLVEQIMGQDSSSTVALSKRKTTVAVLRGILREYHGREDNFAKLAEQSQSWVKKVSAGQEPLADEVTRVLELNVGIGLAWSKGDPNLPPVSYTNRPFDYEFFQNHRAKLRVGVYPRITVVRFAGTISNIAGIGAAAGRKGKASLFHWKLSEFLKQCRDEFGCDEAAGKRLEKALDKAKVAGMSFQDRWVHPDNGTEMTFAEGESEDDVIKDLLKTGGDTRNAKKPAM